MADYSTTLQQAIDGLLAIINNTAVSNGPSFRDKALAADSLGTLLATKPTVDINDALTLALASIQTALTAANASFTGLTKAEAATFMAGGSAGSTVFDAAGRISTVTDTYNGAERKVTVEYTTTTSTAVNRITVRYAGVDTVFNYAYDANGRLISGPSPQQVVNYNLARIQLDTPIGATIDVLPGITPPDPRYLPLDGTKRLKADYPVLAAVITKPSDLATPPNYDRFGAMGASNNTSFYITDINSSADGNVIYVVGYGAGSERSVVYSLNGGVTWNRHTQTWPNSWAGTTQTDTAIFDAVMAFDNKWALYSQSRAIMESSGLTASPPNFQTVNNFEGRSVNLTAFLRGFTAYPEAIFASGWFGGNPIYHSSQTGQTRFGWAYRLAGQTAWAGIPAQNFSTFGSTSTSAYLITSIRPNRISRSFNRLWQQHTYYDGSAYATRFSHISAPTFFADPQNAVWTFINYTSGASSLNAESMGTENAAFTTLPYNAYTSGLFRSVDQAFGAANWTAVAGVNPNDVVTMNRNPATDQILFANQTRNLVMQTATNKVDVQFVGVDGARALGMATVNVAHKTSKGLVIVGDNWGQIFTGTVDTPSITDFTLPLVPNRWVKARY